MSMCFTVRRRRLCENMSHFNQSPEFQKELKKLGNKYPSLQNDLKKFEVILSTYPTGIGKNFDIIYFSETIKIVKARLACKSLRGRSIRVIYAYHNDTATFVHIELYFKGDKENEDRKRIKDYLKLGTGFD